MMPLVLGLVSRTARANRWETREAPKEMRMVVIAAALVVVVLVVLAITIDR
jgi:hypothetical protein